MDTNENILFVSQDDDLFYKIFSRSDKSSVQVNGLSKEPSDLFGSEVAAHYHGIVSPIFVEFKEKDFVEVLVSNKGYTENFLNFMERNNIVIRPIRYYKPVYKPKACHSFTLSIIYLQIGIVFDTSDDVLLTKISF